MLYTFICSHILSAIWLYLHVFRSCPLTDRMLFTWCIEKCLTTGVVTTVTTLPPTTMCIIAFFRWNKRPLDTIHPYRKTISWCNNDPFLVDWGLLCNFSNKGLFLFVLSDARLTYVALTGVKFNWMFLRCFLIKFTSTQWKWY